MTEKIPVTKKRGFKTFLKIISLPVLVSVFVVAINSDSVLSTIDKKYDSFLIWQHSTLGMFKNVTIIKPVSLDKKGIIFDEIFEPRWSSAYSLIFISGQKDLAPYLFKDLFPMDLYADLLVEIDELNTDGESIRIITHLSNHQPGGVAAKWKAIMDSWNLSAESLVDKNFNNFERGKKYHIRIVNQSINKEMLGKPYIYYIELTNLNIPK